MRERNRDRRNPAGGLAEGERTIRKGGWFRFGSDQFYSERLIPFAGSRVFVNGLEDAFSPLYAECLIDSLAGWIKADNLYHLKLAGRFPQHLSRLLRNGNWD